MSGIFSAEARLIHVGIERADGLIRLSACVEPAADLITDIDQARKAVEVP